MSCDFGGSHLQRRRMQHVVNGFTFTKVSVAVKQAFICAPERYVICDNGVAIYIGDFFSVLYILGK